MSKFLSMLRAMMSQDMNLFKYTVKDGSSNASKIITPIILGLLVMFAIASFYLPLAEEFNKIDMMNVYLGMVVIFPTFMAFVEGIYKSQSILFEARDNELLFAMPISKKSILLARFIKLYVFQLLFSSLLFIPAVVLYAFYKKADVSYYLISVLTLILLPIIPTAISCVIGYIIKSASVKFKHKQTAQLIFTFAVFTVVMMISVNAEPIMKNMLERAEEINTCLEYYYPVKAYQEMILNFNDVTPIILVTMNAMVLVAFILIVGKTYFKIISKASEKLKTETPNSKLKISFKKKTKYQALIYKELSRFFSSTVYVINTLFGMVLLIIATVALCSNFEGTITAVSGKGVTAEDISTLYSIAPKVFMAMIIAMSFMTSITSSSSSYCDNAS